MSAARPLDMRIAEASYRAVLRAFPRSFRRRLGCDMLEAFRDGCLAERARRGRLGVLAHALHACTELAGQGLRERTAPTSSHLPRSPRRGTMIDRLARDFAFSARTLWRAPAFTAVAVLTLAVAIGANTAIFSVVRGVLLQPLPYDDPDRLVTFDTRFKDRTGNQLSEPELIDLQTLPSSFEAVGAVAYQTLTLGGAETPERIQVNQLTAGVLPLLGVEPAIGRTFTPADDTPDSDRVALLSHALWRQGFGADPGVIGATIELEGIAHTVIGVMPAGFGFPQPSTRAWIPLRLDLDDLWERNNHYLYGVGRLAEGVSLPAAQAELDAIAASLNERYPEYYDGGFGFAMTGMLDDVVGETRTSLMALLAAVAFVLLVACTNVANLLLARADGRRREIALRSALGGGRGAIVRQLLVESLLLGSFGGALGVALATAGTGLLLRLSPDAVPRAENISMSLGVLGFAVMLSVVTSVLFGMLPALHAAAGNVETALREGARAHTGRARGTRSRGALVVAEVALASVLLVGGGVMLRSFVNLRNVDPGFDYGGVLALQTALPAAAYDEPPDVVRYYEEVIESVRTLPGVEAVGAVERLPLARGANRWSLQVEGGVVADVADAPVGQVQVATPGYFEVMRLRLRSGRFFDDGDVADSPGVAIVSETFARTYWPGEDAVGKQVKVFLEDWPWLEVVGVVGDVQQIGLDAEPFPKIYFAHAQAFQTAYVSPANMSVVVRTAGDPAALIPAARERIWSVNDTVPFGLVATMEDVLADSIAPERFVVVLLSLFAAVALFLAAVGIAGVIAYAVAERTREIGIRVALGAERADVVRLVVLPALGLTLTGVALGVAGSTLFTGVLEELLFGVEAIDPMTYAAVVVIFLGIALAACLLPARRAARLDPAVTLRAE